MIPNSFANPFFFFLLLMTEPTVLCPNCTNGTMSEGPLPYQCCKLRMLNAVLS